VPLALPLPPLVTVNQLVLLVAVHEQPLVVVTVLLPGPPLLANDALVGETVKAHAAASVIVTACPATVSVPLREEPVVFAATA
jgi:hypothetical protein